MEEVTSISIHLPLCPLSLRRRSLYRHVQHCIITSLQHYTITSLHHCIWHALHHLSCSCITPRARYPLHCPSLHLARPPSTLLFLHYTTVPDALFIVHHYIWHTHPQLSYSCITPPFQMPSSLSIIASGTPTLNSLIPALHHRARCPCQRKLFCPVGARSHP